MVEELEEEVEEKVEVGMGWRREKRWSRRGWVGGGSGVGGGGCAQGGGGEGKPESGGEGVQEEMEEV